VELVKPSDAERKAVATAEVEHLHMCKLSQTLDTKPVCHYSVTNTTGDHDERMVNVHYYYCYKSGVT